VLICPHSEGLVRENRGVNAAHNRRGTLEFGLWSFADYSVLLILEDSIYRKDKGARNSSWRFAGT
jgi:hypothetical protein